MVSDDQENQVGSVEFIDAIVLSNIVVVVELLLESLFCDDENDHAEVDIIQLLLFVSIVVEKLTFAGIVSHDDDDDDDDEFVQLIVVLLEL